MFDFITASKIAIVVLSITIFFCMYRAIIGPTVPDRIIGINMVGTKVTVMFVFIGVVFQTPLFMDIAMVYALLLFISTIAFTKYLWFKRLDR